MCHKKCDISELEWRESDSEDGSDGSDSNDSSISSSGSESESDDDGGGHSNHPDKDEDVNYKVGEVIKTRSDQTVRNGEGESVSDSKEKVHDVIEITPNLRTEATTFLGVVKNQQRSPEDLLSTPLPGETLKTFYDRTREYWAQKAHEHSDNRGKSLRRDGFQLADDRYQIYKPVLDEIEKIQVEAGLEDGEMSTQGGPAKVSGLGVDSRNRR